MRRSLLHHHQFKHQKLKLCESRGRSLDEQEATKPAPSRWSVRAPGIECIGALVVSSPAYVLPAGARTGRRGAFHIDDILDRELFLLAELLLTVDVRHYHPLLVAHARPEWECRNTQAQINSKTSDIGAKNGRDIFFSDQSRLIENDIVRTDT